MTQDIAMPVLIVGAGPVGLALALDLARRGTRSMVIDQRIQDERLIPAKAGLLNERTLELCRRWGIAGEVANWGCPTDYPRDTVYCTQLVGGHYVGRSHLPSTDDRRSPFSPEILRKCPQFIFDPILESACKRTGLVQVERGLRLLDLKQSDDYVSAMVENVTTGEKRELRAQYLAGCDGAGSTVRQLLDVPFEGRTLDYSISVIVSVDDLARHHAYGKAERFMFLGPSGTWCNATSMDYRTYWRFTYLGYQEAIDMERLDVRSLLHTALGTDSIPMDVLGAVPWRRSQCAARRFVVGRVALAGDAAHTTSPTGGHGLNTGLGDAAGLGWVLDACVRGWGGPALLPAYEAERRPVAIRNSTASNRHYRNWVGRIDYSAVRESGADGDAARRRIGDQLSDALHGEWNSQGIALGYRYENSPAIIADGTAEPPDSESEYVPTSRAGHRAPHVWLDDGRSILDLFGTGFVLLISGDRSDAALSRLAAEAKAAGIPLAVHALHGAEQTSAYEKRYSLVRPDGHIAWRGDRLPADTGRLLRIISGREYSRSIEDPAFPQALVA